MILIDHTSQPGGAELALPRIARHSRLSWQFAFLEPLTNALPFDDGVVVVAPKKQQGPLAQMFFLRRLLREHPGDVIASNTLRAAVLVAALQSQHQVHVQLLRDGVSSDSLSLGKRLASRFAFSRVTKILPNSVWTGRSVPSRFRERVSAPVFSPSGTPADVVTQAPDDLPDIPLRLLSLSRVVEWKGIHVILEALSLLTADTSSSSIELTIAGDALMGSEAYVERLRSAAAALPFVVVFLPHQLDVDTLLTQHDVLVHASIRPEPFGQVIVQGLSHGLPVLASRGGGPDELIRDGETGLLHEPGDPRSLAASISLLLKQPATRKLLGTAGARAAASFSDTTCVSLLDAELVQVMTSNGR